jgi:hypothetical protein
VSPVRYGLPTVYLCVPYGSHSKQRLFLHTALTGWDCENRKRETMKREKWAVVRDTTGGENRICHRF